MPSYRPSGVLQLLIRLDDGFAALPQEAIDALQGVRTPATQAGTSLEAFAPVADGYTVLSAVLPEEVVHERNSPRQADTLSFRIDYRELPIPPRAIRAVGVVWYAGTVPFSRFSEGMRRGLSGRNSAAAVLVPSRENLRFLGFADTVEEDDAAGQLAIECRDYTGVLLDTRVPASVLADTATDVPLDALVLALLRGFPGNAMKGLTVEFVAWEGPSGEPEPFPTVSNVYGTQGKARKGKSPRLSASGGGSDISYWDLLTDVCVSCGYLPVIEEDRLRVIPPRTLYTMSGDFRRTVLSNGVQETLTRRRLVYGQNVKGLSFRRMFSRMAVPSIVVSSTAPGLRQPLRSRWPPEVAAKKRGNSVLPSGRGAQDRSELVLVRGVTTQAELDRLARNLWHEYAVAEYTGRVETDHLASYGGDNDDPDLLAVRSGDPIEVVRQAPGRYSALLSTIAGYQKRGERVDALQRSGMTRAAALAVVDLYDATAGSGSTFRVKAAKQTWRFGTSPSVQVGLTVGTYMTVPGLESDTQQPSGTPTARATV